METRVIEREFALDMLLETEPECRHIQFRKRVWYRAEPAASLRRKSFPEYAEIGNHGRIINEHVDMGIIQVKFNASSYPS